MATLYDAGTGHEITDGVDDLDAIRMAKRIAAERGVTVEVEAEVVTYVYPDGRCEERSVPDCLYDSDTNEYLDADDLGITEEQYDEACRESDTCGQAEGHIYIAGRRVYAAE